MDFYVDYVEREKETKRSSWLISRFTRSGKDPAIKTKQFTVNVSNGDYSDAFAEGVCKLLEDFQREHPNIEYVSDVYFD